MPQQNKQLHGLTETHLHLPGYIEELGYQLMDIAAKIDEQKPTHPVLKKIDDVYNELFWVHLQYSRSLARAKARKVPVPSKEL